MPIIISAEDFVGAISGNCTLPWGPDGFHLPISIRGENEQQEIVRLGTNRICQKCQKPPRHKQRLHTHEQVFGRTGTWEEIEKDGKKYLRRVIPAESPLQSEESLLFLAGQLDAYFQLMSNGQRSIGDIVRINGDLEPYMLDLCRIWARHQISEKKGTKYLRYRDGEYVLTADPSI